MRRRLLIIAIFLLVGAVVNVGVAWMCAVWIDVSMGHYREGAAIHLRDGSTEITGYWEVRRFDRQGAEYLHSIRL